MSPPALESRTPAVFQAGCASRIVLGHVTSKWGVLLLVSLDKGPLRFGALRRQAEGISEKTFSQTRKTLEPDGFIHRDAQAVIPPRVDDSLTELGEGLVQRMLPLVT